MRLDATGHARSLILTHAASLLAVDFRARLVGTLRAASPLFDVPDLVVVGSEVPNLMQPGAASTLVVSQDLDVGVPVHRHAEVKARLAHVAANGYRPSEDEPSVWLPSDADLLELNFVGIDSSKRDASETYVLDDPELPLMVFGPLGFVSRAGIEAVDGIEVPLPRTVGLALEKLVTDRSGQKGDRDLLVALGLLIQMDALAIDELLSEIAALSPDLRHHIRSNLTLLSLLRPHRGMPDPIAGRRLVEALLDRLREP